MYNDIGQMQWIYKNILHLFLVSQVPTSIEAEKLHYELEREVANLQLETAPTVLYSSDLMAA